MWTNAWLVLYVRGDASLRRKRGAREANAHKRAAEGVVGGRPPEPPPPLLPARWPIRTCTCAPSPALIGRTCARYSIAPLTLAPP